MSTTERERLKQLERENRELKRANEILRTTSAFFCPGGARPPTQVMVQYIEEHKDRFGVERICRELPIAPATYYELKARESDPQRLPARHRRDGELCTHIERVGARIFCRPLAVGPVTAPRVRSCGGDRLSPGFAWITGETRRDQ